MWQAASDRCPPTPAKPIADHAASAQANDDRRRAGRRSRPDRGARAGVEHPVGPPHHPLAPVQAKAVAYSNGRAYVSWQPGRGEAPDEYVVDSYQLTTSGRHGVSRTRVAGDDTVVSGLIPGAWYDFAVEGSNAAGEGQPTTTAPVHAVAAVSPPPPTGLRLTASLRDNQATISWRPPAGSPAPDAYDIAVYEGSGSRPRQQLVGTSKCYAPCTSKSIQLDPGTTASVAVTAVDLAGTSWPAISNAVTVAHPCPLACLLVDATSPGGVESHPASGFLHAIGPKTLPPDSGVLAALSPRHWRVSLATNHEDPAAATRPQVDLTELLSDDWHVANHVGGLAVPPWADWTAYSDWVTRQVRGIEAEEATDHFAIQYWEVFNEPMDGHYYAYSDVPSMAETVARDEQQYLVAYHAIRAADPKAKIVAPSLLSWAASPAAAGGNLDMRTFLDFSVLHQVPPDAISFHDNGYGPAPDGFVTGHQPAQPSELDSSVAQLRALLAARPSLGNPAILINEYGDSTTSVLPGWDVGRIAAIDAANVAEANRACWNTCGDGYLDGLLAGDGRTTLPGYRVYAFYAAMQGKRVPVDSSFSDVTGLAAVDSSGIIRFLVGRHQGCTTAVAPSCPAQPALPVTVTLRVAGAGAVLMRLVAIPMGATAVAPLAAPIASSSVRLAIVHGNVTFTIPACRDGDAYAATISPVAA